MAKALPSVIPKPTYYSSRQRLVVLTFESADDAEAWELAGCPLPTDRDPVTLDVVHD